MKSIVYCTVITLASSLLLSACGFHLRGQTPLPSSMQRTFVQGSTPFHPLAVELRQALRASGTQIVPQAQQAGAILRILAEHFDRRVLSVDNAGKVLEYELQYRVLVELKTAEGQEILPSQEFQMHRAFFNDQVDVLGRFEEEKLLQKEMRREIASTILLRIQALSS